MTEKENPGVSNPSTKVRQLLRELYGSSDEDMHANIADESLTKFAEEHGCALVRSEIHSGMRVLVSEVAIARAGEVKFEDGSKFYDGAEFLVGGMEQYLRSFQIQVPTSFAVFMIVVDGESGRDTTMIVPAVWRGSTEKQQPKPGQVGAVVQ